MSDFIYQVSDVWLFIFLSSVTVLISMGMVIIIEYLFPFKDRYKENQAIGYVNSTVCVIFAVLAGFAALYALTNFNQAEQAVQQEADTAMAIYQYAEWLKEPRCSDIQRTIKNYMNTVIEYDAPLMKAGKKIGLRTDLIIGDMMRQIRENSQVDPPFASQEILKETVALRNARQERIRLTDSALGPDIWIGILLSAFLAIMINCAFGMQFHLHIASVCAVALVVSSTIFLLIALDHPFEGDYSVNVDAFKYYLTLIDHEKG